MTDVFHDSLLVYNMLLNLKLFNLLFRNGFYCDQWVTGRVKSCEYLSKLASTYLSNNLNIFKLNWLEIYAFNYTFCCDNKAQRSFNHEHLSLFFSFYSMNQWLFINNQKLLNNFTWLVCFVDWSKLAI